MANSKLLPAAAAGFGVLFVASALNGWRVIGTVREIVAGKSPVGQANAYPISGSGADLLTDGYSGQSATGSVIVSDVMSYVGGPYVWGASGPPGSGNDCSGLVNHVLGADLHMGIPGYPDGQYSGHGPVTGQYYIWSGATTVPAAQMEPGDLCCWPTHIGIATGDGQMISALNPSAGVVVTTVQGGAPIGEPLLVRRLKTLTQAQALPSGKLTALTKTGGL